MSDSPTKPFTWRDGERTIAFGRGALARAPELLGHDYVLLTTARAADCAPEVVAAASAVHRVGPGHVDELAGDLLDQVDGELLVALGGGRVIDVAKALAAARPGDRRRVGAIPTTLSAAEMTRGHLHARGVDPATPRVRPAIVINDPAVCASQPEPALAASAANSLGHAVEGQLTTITSPVPSLAGAEAALLIAGAWEDSEPDRDALALASLLSGYAIEAASYGLHHVLAQTLRRVGGAGHAQANAVMLPHTLGRLTPASPLIDVARDLARRAGAQRIRDIGVPAERLDACADAAARRPELDLTPPRATRDEIRALYDAAW